MRSFLKKILFFSIPLLIIYTAAIVIVFFTAGNVCAPERLLKENVSTIIVGDSHTECALNDSLLNNTQNLSKSSESYFFSYHKIAYFLHQYPRIDTVILGFAHHNTSSYIDKFTYKDDAATFINRYYPILTESDKLPLLLKNPSLITKKDILENGIENFISCDKKHSFMGEYNRVNEDKTVDSTAVADRLNSQYYARQDFTEYGSFNLKYLDKIIQLCNDNDVTLILVTTPTHYTYEQKVPDRFRKYYKEVTGKYNDLTIIDMSTYLTRQGQYFLPDGSHMNLEGAILTTNELKRRLNKI